MNPLQPPLPPEFSDNLRSLEEQLRQRIFADAKTQLSNLEAMEALWHLFVAQSSVHLLFVEMDDMKRLNNEFGHDNADLFLVKLGSILKELCSNEIYAFHVSGDEFFVVACNLSSLKVTDLAVRIIRET